MLLCVCVHSTIHSTDLYVFGHTRALTQTHTAFVHAGRVDAHAQIHTYTHIYTQVQNTHTVQNTDTHAYMHTYASGSGDDLSTEELLLASLCRLAVLPAATAAGCVVRVCVCVCVCACA